VFQLIFQLRGDSQGTACVHDCAFQNAERSILITVRPHTERVRAARPEEISRHIVQRQQRQSRFAARPRASQPPPLLAALWACPSPPPPSLWARRTSSKISPSRRALSEPRSPSRALSTPKSGGGIRQGQAGLAEVGGQGAEEPRRQRQLGIHRCLEATTRSPPRQVGMGIQGEARRLAQVSPVRTRLSPGTRRRL
jgi:hypothetical protein